MQAIRRSPVVTIAAVSGYCLGGAFELALACDLRVVTTTAALGLPEIKVGVPSVIDAALLPGFVGLSKAREMILTGDTYRLDQLPPHSIANVVTEPGQLAEATEHLLERAATHTSTVTAAQRRLFSRCRNPGEEHRRDRGGKDHAARARGGDMATPQEALAAAYESWNAGDLDGYLCLYDEGIVLHGYSPSP
jgi:enoyl-CoA hydratase/carnithine racemase